MEGGIEFEVTQGARFDEVIQKLMLYLLSPECIDTAPIGLRVVAKSKTTIDLRWKVIVGETYNVTYTDGVTSHITVVDSGQHQLINLNTATEYTINVVNASTFCSSVTMKVRTN
jgi:hypothetical protein